MKNETFENQVARVLNEMVASGEIEAKVRNGETFYRKAPKTKQVVQVKLKTSKFEKRSIAAKKAWATRRARAGKTSSNVSITITTTGSERAKKAWITRRLKAGKIATASVNITVGAYSERAKKAWITRRLKCKNNPAKRTERLELAKKLVKPELGVKYKLRSSEKSHNYVSFDMHLERAWHAYEASVKKALLARELSK
jgi:seryl-tRNA(Sec) selenium transferase